MSNKHLIEIARRQLAKRVLDKSIRQHPSFDYEQELFHAVVSALDSLYVEYEKLKESKN